MYLDNFLFKDELFKELEEHNLIIRVPLFKNSIRRIVIIDTYMEKYLMKEIEKYNYLVLNSEKKDFEPQVREFATIMEEVEFVAGEIRKLLKKIDINSKEYHDSYEHFNFKTQKKLTEKLKSLLEPCFEKEIEEDLDIEKD